jgi:rubrerythrin
MTAVDGKAGPEEVIEALAAHEDALGDLYATYAVKFPDAAFFWEDLSAQEYGHGSLLRDLSRNRDDSAVFVENGRFQVETLRLAREFVLDVTVVAVHTDFSLERALGIAFDLEQAIIEQQAYEVVSTDSENVKKVLEHLRSSSMRHRDSISAYLDRLQRL